MPSYLHHIESTVPEAAYTQDAILERMRRHLGSDRRVDRMLRSIYAQSGIATRHSVVPDFFDDTTGGAFFDAESQALLTPGTRARNEIYTAVAKQMAPCLARQTVQESGFAARDITHIVTVSCTGFFQPGIDYAILRGLGLPPTTSRTHIGFMGCYAAFPALKVADAFCRADPDAVVLVLCLELCTLHLQYETDLDHLIACSLFADGAAAAIVSARSPKPGARALAIEAFFGTVTDTGEADMAWTLGDLGFDIRLSTYVPDILGACVADAIAPLLAASGSAPDALRWAVHPGGRAILDKVAIGLGLTDDQIAPSRAVLARYGNMSSPTVLFIVDALRRDPSLTTGDAIGAMAFGPGLTLEAALLRRA
jgi:predicted naringenin-chalcone synthase